MPRLGFPDVVDAVTVRIVAALVLVVAAVALLTGWWWLYGVLAADFVLRSAFGPAGSPFGQAALRWLRPRVGALPRPTAGPPKRFAATIGAVLSSGAFLLGAVAASTGSIGAATVMLGIATVMVVFPALESLAGICVGCLFYTRLMRVGLVDPRSCAQCSG